jgi:xanthine dehydrogenase accessory factor
VKDIIEILERWCAQGTPVALASVVERVGSAPRDPGAALAVAAGGEVAGGVTGGCVEPAVIVEAQEVLAGSPGRLVSYGLDDDRGYDVGLNCGGRIAVAVYRLDPGLVAAVAAAVRDDRAIAVTLRLDEHRFGEQAVVALDDGGTGDDEVARDARSLLELGESGIVETVEGAKVFVESYAPRPNLYLFGASDHVAALARVGALLGYRVTVCDPRRAFLTPERFPDADELSDQWPDRFLERAPIDSRTAICMMTHDLKFDVPALKVALGSPAGFIGAIGSARTRADRTARLRDEGVGEAQLVRLHAPVGVPIGARTPEEVAISIAAQLVEAAAVARSQRPGARASVTVLSS